MFRFRYIYITSLLLLAVLSLTLEAQVWLNYPYTPDGSLISFPADEGWHPDEAIEWWYIAGHLHGETSGTSYSFMLSYFYYPGDTLGISYEGFRILNLANDDTGEFHTETMPVLRYNDLATDQLHLDVLLLNMVSEKWVHREEPAGTLVPFEYEVSASAGFGGISLSSVLQKRPLIPGDDGLFDQGANSYTYYYSLTNNIISGSIDFNGTSEPVSGTAWIDRQYGSFNPNTEETYEWFFLQLSNGMDLNIWNLFTPENSQPEEEAYKHLAVYVDEDTQYTEHDFILERLAYACIPGSGNCYAQEWRLTSDINKLDLVISTLHHNSEIALPFTFFEGATTVSGTVNGTTVTGEGFAELLKTYEAPQIELTSPKKRWNENFPIQWTLENPDDGRPLLYNLAYTTNQGSSWFLISEGLSDTLFYWNNHPFVNGDSCRFMVVGYTADGSLQGVFEASTHTLYDNQYTHTNQEKAPIFHFYPNPVENTLWIDGISESLPLKDKLTFQVFDLTGRFLIQGILSKGELDVSKLNTGAYILILHTTAETSSHSFIKR